ncbi:MAG: glycosyltransferase [Bacteroidia bacterium]|nr:glycosyltransferase [Bacteroidia bacterium]MDW8346723.1 glycosyltransferase [Bacteroidia bacterium]
MWIEIIFGIYAIQIICYAVILWIEKRELNSWSCKKVAVLIACRNEERNILSCLQSLDTQDYPKEYFEVWIGDDDSTDNTALVVQNFIKDKANFHYVKITQNLGQLKAKQNVLAQLAHKTDAEILCITDADIITPKTWINTLVRGFESPNVGIVCGTTYILPKGFFNILQSVDWLFYMGIAKANLDIGLPITAVGNNMAVHRAAYRAVGGYENIPFSLTEDYKLFKEILKRTDYTAKWIFSPLNTNITYGISSLYKWLEQRKRWLKGGIELPFFIWLLMLFNVCVEIMMYLSFIKSISLFAALFLGKTLFNTVLFISIFSKLQIWHKDWLWAVPVYTLYQMGLIPILFIYFILPIKVRWKERRY